jgi:phage-related protein
MITLPAAIKTELQKIASTGAMLYLLEIPYTADPSLDIRLVCNTEEITWNGYTWTASLFYLESIEESGSGKLPELMASMSNIGGLVEAQILARNNLDGCDCTIYVVNSLCLDETTPIWSATFQVAKVVINRQVASVKLSVPNPYLLNYPSTLMHGTLCQYPTYPGDPRCNYTPYLGSFAGDGVCNRTIGDCQARWGSRVYSLPFGGQLGLQGEYVDDGDI